MFAACIPTMAVVGAGWTFPCIPSSPSVTGGSARVAGAISSGHPSGLPEPAKNNTDSTSSVAAVASVTLSAYETAKY